MATPEEIRGRTFKFVRRGYDLDEVNDFLTEVADDLQDANQRAGAAEAAVARPAPAPAAVSGGPDAFGQLGEEVAAVLRQAHVSVDRLRQRAEAEAAGIRQLAEADRAEAAELLARTQQEADTKLTEAQRRAAAIQDQAAARARARTAEIVEEARLQAHAAIEAQRNVRVRLTDAKVDVDRALDHLAEEDVDPFVIDLTGPSPGGGVVAPPGSGPPSPPVPPPMAPTGAGVDYQDLPYDEDGDEASEDERPDHEPPSDDGGGGDGLPPVPPPPLDFGGGGVVDVIDDEPSAADEAPDDPLARMVQSAVERALRRRQDADDPRGSPN